MKDLANKVTKNTDIVKAMENAKHKETSDIWFIAQVLIAAIAAGVHFGSVLVFVVTLIILIVIIQIKKLNILLAVLLAIGSGIVGSQIAILFMLGGINMGVRWVVGIIVGLITLMFNLTSLGVVEDLEKINADENINHDVENYTEKQDTN